MIIDARTLDKLRIRILDLREALRDFDLADKIDLDTKRRKADHLALYAHLLVNRSKSNESLLMSAGVYDQIRVPDTTKIETLPGINNTRHVGALVTSIQNGRTGDSFLSQLVKLMPLRAPNKYRGMYVPRLDAISEAPTIGLAEWWNGSIGSSGEQITRRSVCSIIRSQDGLGHLDPIIKDREYLRLAGYEVGKVWVEEVGDDTAVCTRTDNGEISRLLIVGEVPDSGESFSSSTSGPLPVTDGVSSIVRQIAGELDHGLRSFGI